MKNILRSAAAVAAAALSATTLTVAASPAGAQTAGVNWGECPVRVDQPGAQCGTVEVPVDHANPDGEKMEVSLVRLPAGGEKRGTVFANPGGPGVDAMGVYGSTQGMAYPAAMREHYDVVAVQPRGLSGSRPMTCSENASADFVSQTVNVGGAVRSACEATHPGFPRQITTENTAGDWESVRAALGEDRINILGVSYGTLLGSVYASTYPERVDKLVLDSGFNRETMWAPLMNGQRAGYERSLHDFFGWVAANDETYHLGDTPLKAYQSWSAAVTAEAGTNPTVAPPAAQVGDVPAGLEWAGQSAADLMTATGLQRVQLESLASQATNPGANQSNSELLVTTRLLVPTPATWDVLAQMINGSIDPAEAMGAADEMDAETKDRALAEAAEVEESFIYMQNTMICNESEAPVNPALWPEALWYSLVTGDIFASPGALFGSGAYCSGAPATTKVRPLDGSKLEHRPLQLQATGDPQTVYGNFDNMAGQMNSQVVTVHGPGHGQFGAGNPAADELVMHYLETGEASAAEIQGIDPSDPQIS
ncbi:alpha/beta fold hydrolase [Corynebacterium frankenforstense]|uniref:alpha/beta fold hydrolase n=1 Tax=Corynebacterium frankenforstense TaxID=1230998 RepID=UPI001FEC5908|nr:alpha/beta fold hydrolase [Corynebacterium frankenforstense]